MNTARQAMVQRWASWTSDEREVLLRIAASKTTLANTVDFMLSTAFPYPEREFGQDLLVAINVDRALLGLDPKKKPGDIDLLMVPLEESNPNVDRAMALEAKIVRPSVRKPDRNAGSMGVTQAKGLLDDGFPYVGLLHISIPEPLPEDRLWSIPFMGTVGNGAEGSFGETGEKTLFDPFPLISADRQEGRLQACKIPSAIAFKAIGLHVSRDREGFAGNSLGNSRRGKRNPNVNQKLRSALVSACINECVGFRCIRWYQSDASN